MERLLKKSFKVLIPNASCVFRGAWLRTRKPSTLKTQRVLCEFVSVAKRNDRMIATCGTQAWFRNSCVLAFVSKLAIMGQTRTLQRVTVYDSLIFSTLRKCVKKSEKAKRPILAFLVLHLC